jgi:hypothetical protein
MRWYRGKALNQAGRGTGRELLGRQALIAALLISVSSMFVSCGRQYSCLRGRATLAYLRSSIKDECVVRS